MAEDTGLEPAGLLHLTRFPGELLSHSVNPPRLYIIYHMQEKFARLLLKNEVAGEIIYGGEMI